MKTNKRILIFGFIFLFMGCLAIPAHAQGGFNVSNDQAVLSFPESVTFSARIDGGVQITSVILEYGVMQLTCGEVVAKAFPDFTPGTSVSVQWTWDMRQSGSEPPGARIWWRWRVMDASGGEFTSPQQTITWLDNIHNWQMESGGNINLHWYDGSQSFGTDLHTSAVDALNRLTQETGIRSDQPIDLYIYANTSDMQEAILYEPSWTGGVAYAENNIVIIGISASDIEWGKSTEAHELTHVLVGNQTFSCLGFMPTWLSEGLAMYGEGGLESADQSRLDAAITDNSLMSVRSLGGGFSEEYDRASLAYAESYSIVNFLLNNHSQDQMTSLLAALREGETADDALIAVYGYDVDGMEDAWRMAIGAAPRIQTANPTPMPTPTIVPTFVPISGDPQLAVTPIPMPTAKPTPLSTDQAVNSETPTVQSNSLWTYLCSGLFCLFVVAGAVIIGIILMRVRRKRGGA